MWAKEVELLAQEKEWTRDFFRYQAKLWEGLETKAKSNGDLSLCCYSAGQYDLYSKLAGLCL